MKEIETRDVELTEYQVSEVKIRGHQSDAKQYEPMKLSIQQHGVHTPILLRIKDGVKELVEGLQRTIICRELGIKIIPARIFENMSDIEARALQMSANRNRIPPKKKEEADHLKIMLIENPDMTQAQLAEIVGISQAEISNLLSLDNLIPETHADVNSGKITGVKAVQLSKMTPEDQKMCINKQPDTGTCKIDLPTDEFIMHVAEILKLRRKGKKTQPKEYVFKSRPTLELAAKCEEFNHLVETTPPEDDNYALYTIQHNLLKWVGAIDEDSIREREEKRKKKTATDSLETLEKKQQASKDKLKEYDELVKKRKAELMGLQEVTGV